MKFKENTGKACVSKHWWAELGMSLRKVTLLGSNLASGTDLKRIQTPHRLCCDFGGYKTLQLVDQVAQFKFESKFVLLLFIWQSLWSLSVFQKVIARGQNQLPSSWGCSPALLARVGRASTNTGRFPVCCSHCGPRQAHLRKTCYHSCDTDSVQEPIRS